MGFFYLGRPFEDVKLAHYLIFAASTHVSACLSSVPVPTTHSSHTITICKSAPSTILSPPHANVTAAPSRRFQVPLRHHKQIYLSNMTTDVNFVWMIPAQEPYLQSGLQGSHSTFYTALPVEQAFAAL